MHNLPLYLSLLMASPREFIYSWLFSPRAPIRIRPFNPRATRVADRLISQIKKLCPGLSIYFLGSSSLKIAGQGDIDLFLACPPQRLPAVRRVLTAEFGAPVKRSWHRTEWHFVFGRFPVELVVLSPQSRELHHQLKTFIAIKKHLSEYELVKNNSDHLPAREYILRRMAFFNRINHENQ